jgi:RNA polymerase sigma-B factor
VTHKPSHRRPTHRSQAGERADRARRTDEVLDRLDGLDASDAQAREALLQDLVEVNMPVARSIAARYRHRGISAEDLEQVAYLALVKVARTYDRASGHDFMSYAVPSIRGEVRRYFRDHGWMVRPPRRVQELQSRITAVESELTTRLGRPPSAAELAADLGEPEDDVREALAANGCFTPTSLDHVAHTAGSTSLSDQLGLEEGGFGAVEARVVLAPLVDGLTARERRILDLRFFRGCTQQEIADDIGVTQMQVSRLLSRLLSRLREDRRAEHPISA